MITITTIKVVILSDTDKGSSDVLYKLNFKSKDSIVANCNQAVLCYLTNTMHT